ncbi:hypothetical protein [Lentzea sp. NPDC059081]|uniref:hypothetical protein n=1 Tax=Lentzea sp. NPDC059081 TaxID=3346719 RepID=UPI00367B9878
MTAHSNTCAIHATARPEELTVMAHDPHNAPPLLVTDVLRIAQDVLGDHAARLERYGNPDESPELARAIELAREIIKTRDGVTR